ncbi:MAG: helix-turn-helix domain-containing protein [Candidatus Eremiobacteraeota bacterium]|nr:helix-turn-helix domain-containing protein [Candidatus Eremiobacteraeota bacterium]MBV8355841.1 helix-turn-helix domain-containing protein [Candidatus Eremiobacteraeota bacterium]
MAASGGGAKALCAHLSQALGAPVLLEDAEWRHLALAGSGSRSLPPPPTAREFVDPAAAATDGAAISAPGGVVGRAFAVRAGDATLGWLTVWAALDEQIPLARLTANAIAVELARDATGSRGRRRSFWERLLTRAYDDPSEARDDAAARGITLASHYVAVVIEPEGLDETVATQRSADVRKVASEVLGGRGGELVVLERGGGFVFLVPSALEVDAANARTAATMLPRSLSKARVDVKVVGGVGRRADVGGVAVSVDDAREALLIARRIFGGGRIVAHDDLGMYPLLLRGGVTREELHRFAERVLEPLRAYDEKHQTELVRTLRLFFDVGQNIKVAAAELSVHRHTIFYRLRQIGDIGGFDLDSPHDQLTLRTAIALDALGS